MEIMMVMMRMLRGMMKERIKWEKMNNLLETKKNKRKSQITLNFPRF
jgi:hypothetical protein